MYLNSPEEIFKKYVNLNLISALSAENGRSYNRRGLHRFEDYLTQETRQTIGSQTDEECVATIAPKLL